MPRAGRSAGAAPRHRLHEGRDGTLLAAQIPIADRLEVLRGGHSVQVGLKGHADRVDGSRSGHVAVQRAGWLEAPGPEALVRRLRGAVALGRLGRCRRGSGIFGLGSQVRERGGLGGGEIGQTLPVQGDPSCR